MENAMKFKSWHFALLFYPSLACVMVWILGSNAPRTLLGIACMNTLILLALVYGEILQLRARVEQLEQRARSEQSGT